MTQSDVSEFQNAIETLSEDMIKELVKKVQDSAKDVLTNVYDAFCNSYTP